MILKKQSVIYPSCTIKRKQPVNLVEENNAAFFKEVILDFDPVNLFHYTNCNITPEGIVFKGLSLDRALLIYPQHKKTYNWLYLISSLVKRKKIVLPGNENYLAFFDYWSNSIFHWMCDALPRLESVKELARNSTLLLPRSFEYSYIHETLKAFEFKKVILIEENTYVSCKTLFVPQQITISGQIRPENILSLRKTLLTYFKPKFTGKINHPNIYISRNKAKYRKVLNEQELLPILKKYNFEVVFFEDLSVAEQVELCYNSNNIVSIHGANLTNIIFLQENKNVLELRKKDDLKNNYFYELADSVNCNYFYLECEFEDPIPTKNFFSLHVDCAKFESSINHLVGKKL